MQVTFLMPVYNAEQWLDTSVGSLLAQTSRDWRLIAVDDESNDGSLAKLRQYEAQDERISVMTQENAGPGVARARAIERATTDYVAILDSDDALTPDYVELMLKRAAETDADSVTPDVEFFAPDGSRPLPDMFTQHGLSADMVIDDGHKAFSMTLPWQLHGWQMIRTTLAKEYYTVQQASYSRFNSDEYITRLLYLKSRRTALCAAKYRYRLDPSSITRKPSLLKLDYLKTLDRLLWLCEYEHLSSKVFVDVYNDYYVTVRDMRNNILPQLSAEDQTKGREMIRTSVATFKKKFRWSHLRGAKFSTKLKFALFFLHVLPPPIEICKSFYYSALQTHRRLLLHNRTVSVISNNCWGGFMYQSCHCPYNSPFVGLYMYAPEYIALLRNLRENLQQPLRFIRTEDSKYKDIVNPQYLIAVLGDTGIEIVFMHYHLKEEAVEKWNRRMKRIDWDNLLVKFSDTDGATDAEIAEFDSLPFAHKVCFTAKPHPSCPSVIPMPEYKDKPFVLYEWAYSYRYYDFVKEANKIKQQHNK